MDKNEHLEHHGILGMKWGVRRFQNEDGSLTALGKDRYNGGINPGSPDPPKHAKSEYVKRSHPKNAKYEYDSGSNSWKMKDARHLTDEELNRRNSRLQREKQYKDLTEPPIRKETRQALKKIFVTTAIGVAAGTVAIKYKDVLATGAEWLTTGAAKEFLKHTVRGSVWVL
ncbi:MAG: hypothetical protein J6U54_11500 [Clostridiales bacterium]|nr:hypothetical protein [Clostridiales bacterium]